MKFLYRRYDTLLEYVIIVILYYIASTLYIVVNAYISPSDIRDNNIR